jgi:outer membrane protein
VPLFSGGGIDAKVVEAIANRDKAAADLETARRRAAADAREAYSGYQSGVVQAEALRTALDAGVSAVRGNQQGYHLGIRINSDVLAAEQQLYVSRRDFARARYDALLNGLKLKAAAGTLTIADVIAIDALFARSDRPVVEGL